MKKTIFEMNTVNVLVTDVSPFNSVTLEKLRELKIFTNIFFVRSLQYNKGKNNIIGKLRDVSDIIFGRKLDFEVQKIDLMIFYNMDMNTLSIFSTLYKTNRYLKCARFSPSQMGWGIAGVQKRLRIWTEVKLCICQL